MKTDLDHSRALLQALQDPSIYPHPVTEITIIETHISWVILTGSFAYKIKRPVDLGFLDFSTLTVRRQACVDELRLNRRLAPDLYLDVISFTGTPATPQFNGDSEPFEFAVKMRQFPHDATLDHLLSKGKIQNRHIDQLAKTLAEFHADLPSIQEPAPLGSPEIIGEVVTDTLHQFSQHLQTLEDHKFLPSLQHWMQHEHANKFQILADRKCKGFIRECHGDLHLANVVLIDDVAKPFDGIEFSERLRWIDIISDVAFFTTDVIALGRPDFAWRFLNRYLEYTGDYGGMAILRFYMVYRALVRAKVACIRLNQTGQPDGRASTSAEDYYRYLSIAQKLAHPDPPALIIMHGLSGSGKSTISRNLLQTIGAIRLRSDIERKRMFGLSPETPLTQESKAAFYKPETTEKLYQQLRNTAQQFLSWGYTTIVDATFLKRNHRDLFCQLAKEQNVPFLILDLHSSLTTLKERIADRAKEPSTTSDVNFTVLQQQQREEDPLGKDEQKATLPIKSEEPLDLQRVSQMLLKSRP